MITKMQRRTLTRMIDIRNRILGRHPFYGQLMMNLKFGTAPCGTACTDMEHLIFDPDFAEALSDEEMTFVMLHEVMHCALKHCTRGRGLSREAFNIACDIVVNSNILQSMRLKEFSIMSEPVMHLAPDGREGCLYTAEEVYRMLISPNEPVIDGEVGESPEEGEENSVDGRESGQIDSHAVWSSVDEETTPVGDRWDAAVQIAAKGCSSASVPPSVRDYVLRLENESQVNWKEILHEFIQLYSDRFDFSFAPADRRFASCDLIIPSFAESWGEKVEKLWFCVDTSGSMSVETISEIMTEIMQAILMFEKLSGMISFFDTSITEPVPFEDAQDFSRIRPQGGGGTSFDVIFRYMKDKMEEDLPCAVIILTDGYCSYPKESEALNVPVLWIIYDNTQEAPWGRTVFVKTRP